LEYLELHDNRIDHLDSAVFSGLRAFNGLTKLTELLLAGNKISEIMPGTFENMSSLDHLVLRRNRIEHLDSDIFSGLFKLTYVDLSANKLQFHHPHAFIVRPNIENLRIRENVALQITNDHHFINSHSLSELDIASCNISSLSVETFANFNALEWLDLSYNNLRTVDTNILRALPNLSKIILGVNPLQYDCQLQEVWRWCEDRNIQTVDWGSVPECDTPSEVEGMWWGLLEKGQCLDGNIEYHGDYKNTRYSYNDIEKQENEYEYENNYVYEFFM